MPSSTLPSRLAPASGSALYGAMWGRVRYAGERPVPGRSTPPRRRSYLVREPEPISTLAQARCRSACFTRMRALGPTLARWSWRSESDALANPRQF